MMKILLDTNIVLDYLLQRKQYFDYSRKIFNWAINNKIRAYISASAITDIYYIIKKAKDNDTALNFIRDIFKFVQIAGVDKNVILAALKYNINDFEDAVQNAAATYSGIKIIVTRNIKDFKNSDIKVITPDNFIKIYDHLLNGK